MATSPSHSFHRTGFSIVSLLSLFFLLHISNYSFAQLNVISTPVPTTCFNSNDGQISVTVEDGNGNYRYSYDSTSWSDYSTLQPYLLTDLVDSTFTVYVTDDVGFYGKSTGITVTQPAELTYSVGGQNWTCPSPSCNGSITLTILGGTAPYDTTITLGGNPVEPYTGLCAGTYVVGVEDANGCLATPPTVDYTITLDNAYPTGCVFPPARLYDLATEYPSGSAITAITPTLSVTLPYDYLGNSTGLNNNDSVVATITGTNYTDIEVQIRARQYGGSTNWDDNDFLEISYSLDNLNWTQFFIDKCGWEANPAVGCSSSGGPSAISAWTDIPAIVNGHEFYLMIRVKSDAADKNYEVESFAIRGNSIYSALDPDFSGWPSGCTDTPAGGVVRNYSNQPIHWYCHEPAEFSFIRRWSVEDACGNAVPMAEQLISVGTDPTFSKLTSDTIRDNCLNTDVVIPGPEGADNCGTPTITWEVTTYGANVLPPSGTGDTATITFPRPVLNDTVYVITWTVTDSAGFFITTEQNVAITKPISIALTALDADFCSDDLATFDVAVTGGTGLYSVLFVTITPEVNWLDDIADGTGRFTTQNITYFDGTSETITINVTDANNPEITVVPVTGPVTGGCSSGDITFTSDDGVFTVHQKISTNSLQRVP